MRFGIDYPGALDLLLQLKEGSEFQIEVKFFRTPIEAQKVDELTTLARIAKTRYDKAELILVVNNKNS
jgi:hypothetical protein